MTVIAHTDLAFAGPGALVAMVRSGDVSARELVELYLRRIEALDPQLNAFRVVRAEQALAEADRVDRSAPLAGLPLAVKDDIDLAGRDPHPRFAKLRASGDGRRRADPPPARRRRDPGRGHQRARAHDLPLDGNGRQRRDPQPVGPRAHDRRVVGRLGRGGGRGPGGGRHRV